MLPTAGTVVRLEGFEPPTNGFGSHYSIRLSYRRGAVPRRQADRRGAILADCVEPREPFAANPGR